MRTKPFHFVFKLRKKMKQHPVCLTSCPEHPSMMQWHNTQGRLSKPSERQVNIWDTTTERIPLLFHQAGTGKLHSCLWKGECRRPWTAFEPSLPEDHPCAWYSAEMKWKDAWGATTHTMFTLQTARVYWLFPSKMSPFKTDEKILHSDTKSTRSTVEKTQTSSRPVVPEKPSVRDWLLM